MTRGLRVFDLGRSRRDAGAVKFKRNQGFEPQPLHYAYGLLRSRKLPSLHTFESAHESPSPSLDMPARLGFVTTLRTPRQVSVLGRD